MDHLERPVMDSLHDPRQSWRVGWQMELANLMAFGDCRGDSAKASCVDMNGGCVRGAAMTEPLSCPKWRDNPQERKFD